jgi:predicted acetyltransferase
VEICWLKTTLDCCTIYWGEVRRIKAFEAISSTVLNIRESLLKELSLVEPAVKYKKSFLELVSEVKKSGYESYDLYSKAEDNFEEFIDDLVNASHGINVEEGWAACTSYWLVNHLEVIGVIRIRHSLDNEELLMAGHIGYEIVAAQRRKGFGTKILELGLSKANEMGLNEVLITCDADNVASKRIINNFSAEYLTSFIDSESGKDVLQYRVSTTL